MRKRWQVTRCESFLGGIGRYVSYNRGRYSTLTDFFDDFAFLIPKSNLYDYYEAKED